MAIMEQARTVLFVFSDNTAISNPQRGEKESGRPVKGREGPLDETEKMERRTKEALKSSTFIGRHNHRSAALVCLGAGTNHHAAFVRLLCYPPHFFIPRKDETPKRGCAQPIGSKKIQKGVKSSSVRRPDFPPSQAFLVSGCLS